jgi:hypothetical protein
MQGNFHHTLMKIHRAVLCGLCRESVPPPLGPLPPGTRRARSRHFPACIVHSRRLPMAASSGPPVAVNFGVDNREMATAGSRRLYGLGLRKLVCPSHVGRNRTAVSAAVMNDGEHPAHDGVDTRRPHSPLSPTIEKGRGWSRRSACTRAESINRQCPLARGDVTLHPSAPPRGFGSCTVALIRPRATVWLAQ